MASKEAISRINALLEQNIPSADIARMLDVSPQTVWAVKGNRTQKNRAALNSADASTVHHQIALKAVAIVTGALANSAASVPKEDAYRELALTFASLLSQLTCPDRSTRESAKRTIREHASAGGWPTGHPGNSVDDTNQAKAHTDGGKPARSAPRRWSPDEVMRVIDSWTDERTEGTSADVLRISESLRRTPLAIIIRLWQEGMISLDQGDNLCELCRTPRKLSTINVKKTKQDKGITPLEATHADDEGFIIEGICGNCDDARHRQ